MLVVVDTHPIQYHAPVYRAVEQQFGVPVTAIYGTDCSVHGYQDPEFGARIEWDTDLLTGYSTEFLSTVANGGADTPERALTDGLDAALRRLAPQAALIGGYGTRFHRSAWLALRRLGVPLLFRGETTDDAIDRAWAKRHLRDLALRRAYAECARLLYIGRQSHAHYARLGVPEEKLVFSPYCVDDSVFDAGEDGRARLRPEMRRRLELADDDIAVLFCGKLSARKGADLLVPALRQLPEATRRRIVLVVAGDGAMRAAIDGAAAAAGVRARLCGVQPQRTLSAVYHAADLLVLPSRSGETWGLVVNEALLHGLPCLVSRRVGCAPDLIDGKGSGVIVDADSAAALTQGLARLLPRCGTADTRDACRRAVMPYSIANAAAGLARAAVDAGVSPVTTARP